MCHIKQIFLLFPTSSLYPGCQDAVEISTLISIQTGFSSLSPVSKTAVILCPTSVQTAKLSNKFIKIMFKTRKLLDDGYPIFNMGYGCGIIPNEFFDIDDNYDSDHD